MYIYTRKAASLRLIILNRIRSLMISINKMRDDKGSEKEEKKNGKRSRGPGATAKRN